MTSTYGAPSDMVYTNTLRAEEYRRTVEHIDIFNAAARGAIVLESDPARQMPGVTTPSRATRGTCRSWR